jgi:hypothetical protein
MVDFRINLAKTLTSSAEERTRFYNVMLIYLILCSTMLGIMAYVSTANFLDFMGNRHERSRLLASASAKTGVDKSDFKNTDQAYAELKAYSGQLSELRQVLGQQERVLPIVHNLFVDLPEDVILQSLLVSDSKLAFGLIMPPASAEAGDPVRKLKTAWESNEELMKGVTSIRPLIGERRTMGAESVFYVKFECILKK